MPSRSSKRKGSQASKNAIHETSASESQAENTFSHLAYEQSMQGIKKILLFPLQKTSIVTFPGLLPPAKLQLARDKLVQRKWWHQDSAASPSVF
jgi:hypothetical protein